MSLDDWLPTNPNLQTNTPQKKIADKPKSRRPTGWYIKRADGELEGVFHEKERSDRYIQDQLKSGGKKYEGAETVYVE